MDFVIKVKYGDTLRRFNAIINGDVMDLDMDRLRAKIINLFNLQPDADLTLTYVDEDNDIVTLVEDADLLDAVVTQRLNPLRINVVSNTIMATTSNTRSQSGASTPIRSPRVRSHPPPRVSAGIEEAMKSVPEPFRDVLLKLSNDFISKAALSAPVLAELVEHFSKLGQSNLGPPSQDQDSATPNIPGSDPCPNLNFPVVSGASDDPGSIPKVSTNAGSYQTPANVSRKCDVDNMAGIITTSIHPTASSVSDGANMAEAIGTSTHPIASSVSDGANMAEAIGTSTHPTTSSVSDGANMVGAIGTSAHPTASFVSDDANMAGPIGTYAHPTAPVVINLKLPRNPLVSGISPMDVSVPQVRTSSIVDWEFPMEGGGSQPGKSLPAVAPVDPFMDFNPRRSEDSDLLTPPIPQVNGFNDALGTNVWLPTSQTASNMENGSPVNVPMGGADAGGGWSWHYPVGNPFKRSHVQYDSVPRTFHRGVRCDGCGMHPIMGARFKSKVKDDYDLCNVCFSELGNDADYTRIDHASYQTSLNFNPRFRGPSPRVVRGCGLRPLKSKLESRFILDVNVLDGTSMLPGTPFTKIWRMRNDGTAGWPCGTKLVWTGGDRFANSVSVDLEIPESGYPVGEELDVAVDFTAPLRPGRYTSYWRMATPSGQRFGQRVWVAIQVEDVRQDPFADGSHSSLNLNLPPESGRRKGKGAIVIDVNVEPKDSVAEPDHYNMAPELVTPLVNGPPTTQSEKLDLERMGGHDSLPEGSGAAALPVPQEAASVSYPIIDLSDLFPKAAEFPPPSLPSFGVGASEGDRYEQTLLKELEEMGFKHMDLNKKILRKNEYDLAQSLDDLCSISEWDPMLEELEEMGFSDREMNKKLLMKNGGSIKRVVLDLIAGEKA